MSLSVAEMGRRGGGQEMNGQEPDGWEVVGGV